MSQWVVYATRSAADPAGMVMMSNGPSWPPSIGPTTRRNGSGAMFTMGLKCVKLRLTWPTESQASSAGAGNALLNSA